MIIGKIKLLVWKIYNVFNNYQYNSFRNNIVYFTLYCSLIGFIIGVFISLCVRLYIVFFFIYQVIIDLYEKFGLLFIAAVGFMISVFMYIRKTK